MSDEEKTEGATPSGPKGDDIPPGGGGKADKGEEGHVNPSAPEDSNTTPGSTGEK